MGKSRKLFLYFGIFALLLSFCFQYSTLFSYSEFIKSLFLLSGLVALIVSYMLKKNISFIIKSLILLFVIVIYFYSRQTTIIELVVLVMAVEKDEVDSIIKFCFRFMLVVLTIHIVSYAFAYVTGSSNLNIITRVETNSLRHSFFFDHSNLFGTLCTWTYLSYLYINKNNLTKKHYFIGLGLIIFILLTSDSRTSAIVCFGTIILLAFYKRIAIAIKKVLKHSFVIVGILSYILILLYPKSNIVKTIDSPQMLHSRIKLGYIAYSYHMISPLGNDITYFDNVNLYSNYKINSYTLDSTYYKMLFGYGYIFTIIFFIFIEKKASYIKDEDNFVCFIVAYSLSAFMESFAFYPFIFFPVFVLSTKSNLKRSY